MIHHSHIKCDDCGKRHTPGNPTECIEILKEQIEELKEEGGAVSSGAANVRLLTDIGNLILEGTATFEDYRSHGDVHKDYDRRRITINMPILEGKQLWDKIKKAT